MSRPATIEKFVSRITSLERGRESFRKQSWGAAVKELSAADRESPLDPLALVELAQAAMLTGNDRDGAEILARAHQAFLAAGHTQPAARCAFWLGFTALVNGQMAEASGWLSRADRLLADAPDCVEKGYLLLPAGFRGVHGGRAAEAYQAFAQAAEMGERFGDPDLVALARQGQGRALIRQGEITRGVSLLDEAMVAVTAGEVSPLTAGGVYCSVIEACSEIFDLRRAQEWTFALERWCASQPDMVRYRGHCLIRRAEILQLHGAWPQAIEEARQACDRSSQHPPKPEAGAAFYRLGEIHRLRGEFEAAENAYREAGRWQRVPQPGMALLRLAQGNAEAANAAIRRVAEEVQEPGPRARVLDAYVEIVLAAGEVAAARSAADELAAIAQSFDAPQLHAMAARADGAVRLGEGDVKAAITSLRKACALWSDIDAPYDAARTRVLMATACRQIGDTDAAQIELSLAREVFRRLGATSDLARLEAFSQPTPAKTGSSLTSRELQVLKLVASGKTNRAIAVKLGISEKTVARHVSNIFNKLDLSSRAAATAFAYQNRLV